jgi:hypothetical protein
LIVKNDAEKPNCGKEEEKEEILKAGIHNKAQISVIIIIFPQGIFY